MLCLWRTYMTPKSNPVSCYTAASKVATSVTWLKMQAWLGWIGQWTLHLAWQSKNFKEAWMGFSDILRQNVTFANMTRTLLVMSTRSVLSEKMVWKAPFGGFSTPSVPPTVVRIMAILTKVVPSHHPIPFLGKTSTEKKTFSFGHCPNKGGRGLPMPGFFGPFFFLPNISP